MSKLKSLIGTKKFYKTVIAIALPVMLQQGITSFVSILDNLMVGQLDTISFDAVAIVNQILFIINIALVGGLAGPGIYISQYLGANDEDGMRRSFREDAFCFSYINCRHLGIFYFWKTTNRKLLFKRSKCSIES